MNNASQLEMFLKSMLIKGTAHYIFLIKKYICKQPTSSQFGLDKYLLQRFDWHECGKETMAPHKHDISSLMCLYAAFFKNLFRGAVYVMLLYMIHMSLTL